MILEWEPLAAALREEVQEYGALLNLFTEQQEAILGREPDRVLVLSDAIAAQSETIAERRRERQVIVRAHAESVEQPRESTLRSLFGFFPESVRPLLDALITEVNHLVTRSKRRAQQNQMLLSRTIEVMQGVMQAVSPATFSKTYSPRGRVTIGTASAGARYLAKT